MNKLQIVHFFVKKHSILYTSLEYFQDTTEMEYKHILQFLCSALTSFRNLHSSKFVHLFKRSVQIWSYLYVKHKFNILWPPNLYTSLIIRLYFGHKSIFKRILSPFFLINFHILKNTIQEIYNTNSKIVHFFVYFLNIPLFNYYYEYNHKKQYMLHVKAIVYNIL